jgi:hypothetical protein
MTLEIEVKSVYGNDLIYPLTHTEEIRVLTGKKTLSVLQLNALKEMGLEVKLITPTRKGF